MLQFTVMLSNAYLYPDPIRRLLNCPNRFKNDRVEAGYGIRPNCSGIPKTGRDRVKKHRQYDR